MKHFLPFYIVLLFLTACRTNNAPNIDGIKRSLNPVRYDQLFYKTDTNNVLQGLKKLQTEHLYFTEVFTEHLTGWGKVSDTASMVASSAKHFLTYKDYTQLYKTVQQKFPDTKKHDVELENLFGYIKYYFPKYTIPKLYYFMSGLNIFSAVTYDTVVGVGLDMHLGKDYEFYPSVQLPKYQIERCTPEFITPDMAMSVYESMRPFDPTNKDLLSCMVERGIAYYYMDKVLPGTADNLKIGYTKQQMDWIEKNQSMVYNYILTNKLIYDKNLQKIIRYVTDGPNTQGLPMECPGNAASYIGWQIVRKYMDNNPKISLETLCKNQIPAQTILEGSAYKP
jgi:hypothetical protein